MYWVPTLPKHIWEPYKYNLTYYPNPDAIGSGPFMLEDFKLGEYIVLKRYENYHGTGRKTYLDRVIIIAYGTEEAEMMATVGLVAGTTLQGSPHHVQVKPRQG